MTAKFDDDCVRFSSGREAYANRGIIGINEMLELYEGYDGTIRYPPYEPGAADELSKEDMRELADLMIATWTRFRNAFA
jgi:hypothetical protein